jgi:capsular exopolysaccharide synthesis family protein
METDQSQALQNSRVRGVAQPAPPPDVDDLDNPPNRGLNLRSLIRTLQRQALLIAVVATGVTVAAGYRAMSIPDTYKGDFQLLVEPVNNEARAVDPLTVTRAGGDLPGPDTFRVDYGTQLQILQSPGMLNSIVQEVQRQDPEFTYEQLREGLTVERLVPEDAPDPTRIILVSYEGQDHKLVQKVLQVTAEKFLSYSLEDRKTRFGEGIRFIEDQLPEVQQRVKSIQDQLQRLQQNNDLIDPAAQGGQLATQVNDIIAQQNETRQTLREQETLLNNLRGQLQLTPQEAIAASALSEDPNYQGLQATLQEINSQIAIETARFNDAAPVVRSLSSRRDNIQGLLNERAQQVIGSNLGATGSANPQVQAYQNSVRIALIGQMVEAQNQVQLLREREQGISRLRTEFEQNIRRFPAIARQYVDLTRDLEIATQTLNRLQTQRETLRVEAAQTEIPWELVSDPLIPRDAEGGPVPVPSRASRIVLAGLALGLASGILLALILERYRNVFYTVEDIQEALQLPLVGVIPFSRGAKQSLDFPNAFGSMEDLDDSRLGTAPFREAFSDLYSNVRLSEPPIRSLMVCSAEPGDGKTTVALYLAQTAAGAGQRVLLVDTNLRLPQIHTRLDVPNTKGLSSILTSESNPDELIQPSPLADNLFVLTAGSPLPGSARLLGSDQMKRLMEYLRAKFDLVIYDTPHLFGLTDASFLTAYVDEILMVVAATKTSRTAVERVLNKLVALRVPGVSLVTNYLRENNSPNGAIYSRGMSGSLPNSRRASLANRN